MVKPLIPIIFLAIWVVLYEDKIWPEWENEIPVKNFERGEIQWEYDMPLYFASSKAFNGYLIFPIWPNFIFKKNNPNS